MRADRRQTSGVLWDVVAPWVRWPLHSPRRLLGVVVGLVLVAALWQALAGASSTASPDPGGGTPSVTPAPGANPPTTGGTPPGARTPTPAGTLTSTGASATGTATGLGTPSAPAGAPAVPAGADTAARGLVTAWARPTLAPEQWLAGVRGYLSPELERAMSFTDPARIPARRVTGAPTMTHVGTDAATFAVPTDTGAVRVDLVLVQGRWLAVDLAPASASGPGD